jgi:UDP-N-acetylmuramyl pentapeptide phosphotransferase/UDP-N-acetylglucosamine-1-phosphate transferase
VSAYSLLVPAAVTIVVIAVMLASPLAARIVDRPGERSLHSRDTPRIGGIGLMAGALPVVFLLGTAQIRVVAAAGAGLAALSLADDLRSLPVKARLPCHLAAAAVAIGAAWLDGAAPSPVTLGLGLAAFLAIAWMTNLYNFMDGADGLAGGMAAIGFAAFAAAAARAGHPELAGASLAIASASVGFLAFNFPPARIFMGDAGSVPLGFLAGALGWLGAAHGAWPWWFPLLVFSPFIVDATVTLARRLARREPVFRAHRTHYYQRLVLGGWTHRRLALVAWALMAAAAASALLALGQRPAVQGAIIGVWALAWGALLALVDRRHPRGHGGREPQPPGTRR